MKSQEPKNQPPSNSEFRFILPPLSRARPRSDDHGNRRAYGFMALDTVARQRSQAADWATPLAKQEWLFTRALPCP
jgi:hypothetical protein